MGVLKRRDVAPAGQQWCHAAPFPQPPALAPQTHAERDAAGRAAVGIKQSKLGVGVAVEGAGDAGLWLQGQSKAGRRMGMQAGQRVGSSRVRRQHTADGRALVGKVASRTRDKV